MIKKTFKTIRISEHDHERLKELKEEEYTPICQLIKIMIDQYIQKKHEED